MNSAFAKGDRLAVLASGGLDSAVLVGEALAAGARVWPVYIRCGLRWETAELAYLRRFLAAIASPALEDLVTLEMPVADVYGDHWSLRGTVPDYETPDEAVYIPGRNVLLLSKALLWCHLHDVGTLAMASLSANPFPDATESFLAKFGQVVNEATRGRVRIVRPYAELKKTDVVARGRALPLELTLSCLAPLDGLHCGRCNKCAERRHAFAAARVVDHVRYCASY
jgi:7-cyano-7-deazaguanine synthase